MSKREAVTEYVYRNRKQRADHIEIMKENGFELVGSRELLKPNPSQLESHESIFDWYGTFKRDKGTTSMVDRLLSMTKEEIESENEELISETVRLMYGNPKI